LLIFAHSALTLACDVENIGVVLSQSRGLVDRLRRRKQWHHITRLLTGIEVAPATLFCFSALLSSLPSFYRVSTEFLPSFKALSTDN